MTKALADDWEFNVLGIYNYNRPGKLSVYYDWIKKNHDKISGNILEAGVFQGKSLMATALLLKELGSKKLVYGFDSFAGFPPIYDAKDDLQMFFALAEDKKITIEHLKSHEKLKKHRSMLKSEPVSVKSISSSTDFSSSSLPLLRKKIEYLNLDNIIIMDGDFHSTMSDGALGEQPLMGALLDCDLYKSYQVTLPFVWQRLKPNGMVFLDEYYSLKFPGARIACDEFFSTINEKPALASSDKNDFERWIAVKD